MGHSHAKEVTVSRLSSPSPSSSVVTRKVGTPWPRKRSGGRRTNQAPAARGMPLTITRIYARPNLICLKPHLTCWGPNSSTDDLPTEEIRCRRSRSQAQRDARKKKVLPMFLVSANYRTCDISISLRSFNLLHNLHDFALLDLCFEFFFPFPSPSPSLRSERFADWSCLLTCYGSVCTLHASSGSVPSVNR